MGPKVATERSSPNCRLSISISSTLTDFFHDMCYISEKCYLKRQYLSTIETVPSAEVRSPWVFNFGFQIVAAGLWDGRPKASLVVGRWQ